LKKAKKNKDKKQSELEKLENLICQQEEENNDDNPYIANKNNNDILIKEFNN
jgi:hypothetical protein